MIKLELKTDCCGCTACQQSCPKRCISMKADDEGYSYPVIDLDLCIDCGKCERVCPVINRGEPNIPEHCMAAINDYEEIRHESSSGGIFSLLAQETIASGGIVFGAVFDDKWNVVHRSAETIEQIAPMRGSKYVQSAMGQTFSEVRKELAKGRKVMFSGTQCQVAGLNRFLGRRYPELLTVEVICHGVPSPAVWQSYRPEARTSVNFRDKRNGWSPSGISFDSKFTPHEQDTFMQSFFSHVNMRPSCYACPAKSGRSGADITLGDFWGIKNVAPEIYDNKGTSLVIAHTDKGRNILKVLKATFLQLPYAKGLAGNPSLAESVKPGTNRTFFFAQFQKHGFAKAWQRTCSGKPTIRLWRKLYRAIHADNDFSIK